MTLASGWFLSSGNEDRALDFLFDASWVRTCFTPVFVRQLFVVGTSFLDGSCFFAACDDKVKAGSERRACLLLEVAWALMAFAEITAAFLRSGKYSTIDIFDVFGGQQSVSCMCVVCMCACSCRDAAAVI